MPEEDFGNWAGQRIAAAKTELGACKTMGEASHDREVWSLILQIGLDANAVWLQMYRHLGPSGQVLFAYGFALETDWPSVSAEIGATIGTFVVEDPSFDEENEQRQGERSHREGAEEMWQ